MEEPTGCRTRGRPRLNHLDYLHSRLDAFRLRLFNERVTEPSPRACSTRSERQDAAPDVPPSICVLQRPPRLMRIAPRGTASNQFIFPFHTMITAATASLAASCRWTTVGHADHQRGSRPSVFDPANNQPTPLESAVGFIDRTSDPRTYYYTQGQQANDYLRD